MSIDPGVATLVLLATVAAGSPPPGAERQPRPPAVHRRGPTSWLSICPAPPADAHRVVEQVSLAGQPRFVAISAARPDKSSCLVAPVGAPVGAVRWIGAVSAESAGRLGKGLILQGLDEMAMPTVSEVIPLDEGPGPAPGAGREPPPMPPFAPRVPPVRSLWAWQPALWLERGQDTLQRLDRWGGRLVYVTVPVDEAGEVGDAARLAGFLEDARRQGIDVWAVDGEPRSVLPFERGRLLERVRAYAAFNRRQPADLRLGGLQLDVEPYLLSLAGEHAALHQAYVDTVSAARAAARMPLEVAVPFWWIDRKVPNGSFTSALAGAVDTIAVMDYRTDPALIERFAVPWLRWGVEHDRGVRIALEAGPIPDEPRAHFRPDERGELWHVRVGPQDVLVLFDREVALLAGQAFAYSHASRFRGETLTFRGRTDALRDLLPALERTFSRWRSFRGIALHEVP